MALFFRRVAAPPGPASPPPPSLLDRLRARLGVRQSLRHLRPTRVGAAFLCTGLAVGGAAINTGNNLLYLMLGALLSLVALSGVLSELAIQSLRVERRLLERPFAGAAMAGQWVVRNPRRWLPALAIELSDRGPNVVEDSGDARITVIPAGGERVEPGRWRFARRGRARPERIRVATRYPFGLFVKWYELRVPMDVVVYPSPASGELAEGAPVHHEEGALESTRRGEGDLLGLRELQPGEGLRRIHWKTSARRGRLMAAERAHEQGRVTVHRLRWPGPGTRDERMRRLDAAVSGAAGVVCEVLDQGGELALCFPGEPDIEPEPAVAVADGLLARLAVLTLPGEAPP